jgi:hypothetical protein
MSDNSPAHIGETAALVIPSFKGSPALSLNIAKMREAEARFVEAKTVNPITYADLEHTFNEAYREFRRHHATVGHEIAKAEIALRQAKSVAMMDKYQEYMKDKAKSHDNGDMRDSFLIRDPDYLEALERLNMLRSMEGFIDGRIKVIENVCRYMRKQMDLVIRSGLTNPNLYITQGKKNGK